MSAAGIWPSIKGLYWRVVDSRRILVLSGSNSGSARTQTSSCASMRNTRIFCLTRLCAYSTGCRAGRCVSRITAGGAIKAASQEAASKARRSSPVKPLRLLPGGCARAGLCHTASGASVSLAAALLRRVTGAIAASVSRNAVRRGLYSCHTGPADCGERKYSEHEKSPPRPTIAAAARWRQWCCRLDPRGAQAGIRAMALCVLIAFARKRSWKK